MNKNLLVVSLFVHDMKAPLSVIGSGVVRLHTDMANADCETIGIELIEKIKQTKTEANDLLNHILDMDSSVDTECEFPQNLPEKRGFFSFWKKKKAVSKAGVNQTRPKQNLCQAIDDLKTLLTTLMHLIDAFDIQAGYSNTGHQGSTVLKRMKRNVKTAIHFADNAIAILVSHESEKRVEPCKISHIVKPSLQEVFDLIDPDISDSIESSISFSEFKSLVEKKQIYLNIDEDVWERSLPCDSEKIKQVLVNLVLNAMKFRKQAIDVEIVMDEQRVIFSVADDGKGISKKDQQYIFKNRFQVKSENAFPIRGHGIGLAGAQALLEGINGHLQLESSPGEKTRFSALIENISTPVSK